MINEDEAMIAELQNTNKSRSSLRSKHLAQLEENKATLNEIKTMATQKLISNGATDQDIPNNEEGLFEGKFTHFVSLYQI